MSDSPSRRVALVGLLLALSSTITAVALEVALRLFWGGYYVKLHHETPRGHLTFHATRGWTTAPGVRIEHGKPEFRTMLVHNSLGFRGPELENEKTPGRIRVLALGDSMTYGIGVENDQTYSAELQRLDPRLEVINAGVPGYSPAQELLLLREAGPTLSPDIVLVAYFWNDLVDAYRNRYSRFTVEDGSVRFHFPSPATPDHPAFREHDERVREAERDYKSLRVRSYLYRFTSDRIKILRYRVREKLGRSKDRNLHVTPEETEPAWELSLGLIREIARVARGVGAHPVLVIVPDQLQVEPDVEVVGADRSSFDVQERLIPFAIREGIPFVDLLPGLRAIREREGVSLYHRFDRHWNAAGHRQAAALILAELSRLGLLPSGEA